MIKIIHLNMCLHLQISNKDFVDKFKKSYGGVQVNESDLKNEIKILERSNGGSVDKIKIGNKEIKGTDVRSILNLNSANFDIKFNENYLDISSKGLWTWSRNEPMGSEGMAEEGHKIL